MVRRILWIILFANLAVIGAKLWVGLRAGSLAILGDAAHSGVDALNNLVALAAVRAASRPPDEKHPYGHAKFELVGALAVVAFLSIACFELVSGAVDRLVSGSPPPTVRPLTFVVLSATVVVNTVVAWLESRYARRLGSLLLAADARHTASDVLVTLSVIGGLVAVRLGWESGDAWLGIVVAFLIARAGWGILVRAVPDLVDTATVEAERIRGFVSVVPGVRAVTEIRSRGRLEVEAFVELTVEVSGEATVERGHEIADAVERRLVDDAGFAAAVVHVEPWADAPSQI